MPMRGKDLHFAIPLYLSHVSPSHPQVTHPLPPPSYKIVQFPHQLLNASFPFPNQTHPKASLLLLLLHHQSTAPRWERAGQVNLNPGQLSKTLLLRKVNLQLSYTNVYL